MKEIKNKKLALIILICILLITVSTVTYSYMQRNNSQTTINDATSLTCLNTSLTEQTSSVSLTNDFPVSNLEGMDNVPYTIALKNNCNKYVEIEIDFERMPTSTLLSDYVRVGVNNHDDYTDKSVILSSLPEAVAYNNGTAYIIKIDGLTPNESKTYDFRMWIDELTTTTQAADKVFTGKIRITTKAKTSTTTTSETTTTTSA